GDIGATRNALIAIPSHGGKPMPIIDGGFQVSDARFSPDGHWIAYASDENSPPDIYVVPWPRRGGKWQVSTNGGRTPRWSADGSRIFYLTPDDTLMAVDLATKGDTLEVGRSRALFRMPTNPNAVSPYAVAADGRVIAI